MRADSRFQRFSVLTLLSTLAVIVWGAYVRATGSGAGCGSHWPTCHGEVIPRTESVATLIEYTHRATSGLAFLLVLAQLVWALRAYPKGHLVRRGAAWSMFFMVTEAAVGAGLVLFELVAGDRSLARGFSMSVHLVNTFLLVASMTLTVLWARGAGRPRLKGAGPVGALLAASLAGTLLVGVTGAIAALGDTLFPARTLAEGLAEDVADTAHVFLRLRTLHPFVAAGVAVLLLFLAGSAPSRCPSPRVSRAARALAVLVVVQVGAGLVNLLLLAPVSMQLVHLVLADLVWIALVALAAEALAAEPSPARAAAVS
jgi:heme A synthase